MARYATTQSQYTPYSFENLWKSSEYLTQQHQAAAANFAQLDAQASPLQVLQNNPVDANEYNVVKNYMQQLQTSADKFQKQGLRGGAFQDFVNLNRNYTTTVKPIETALGQRNAYAAVQSEMKVKDNSIQFTKRPTDISLKEFMSGTVTPEFISGAQVQQEVGAIASQIAQQLQTTDVKQLNKYYIEFQHKYGLDLQEIQKQLTADPNSALMTIINKVVTKYPEYQKMNDFGKAAILEYAKQGAYQALGKTVPQVQDSQYISQQQLGLAYRDDKRKQQIHDITLNGIMNQQAPPPRLDASATQTTQALTDESKKLKTIHTDVVNTIKKIDALPKNGHFTKEDIPVSFRKDFLEYTEKSGIVGWKENLEAYLLEVKGVKGYDKVIKNEYQYTIPSTLKDYGSLVNNFFTGNSLQLPVTSVTNKDKSGVLGDYLTDKVKPETIQRYTTMGLDPSKDINGLILRIPTSDKATEFEEVSIPLSQVVSPETLLAYNTNLQMLDTGKYNPQYWKENGFGWMDYTDKEKVRAAIYKLMVQNVITTFSTNQTESQSQSTRKE